jgi:hypothetical protein
MMTLWTVSISRLLHKSSFSLRSSFSQKNMVELRLVAGHPQTGRTIGFNTQTITVLLKVNILNLIPEMTFLGTYYLRLEEDLDAMSNTAKHDTSIKYYPWLHFLFAFQAVVFYLPYFLWTSFNTRSGMY